MIARRFDGTQSFGKLFEQDPHFWACQPHANADVGTALAKAEMAIGGAGQIDAEGVFKHGVIAVAAGKPVQHFITLADGFAGTVKITGGDAAKVKRRRGPADDFIRGSIPDAARLHLVQQFGLMAQGLQTGRDGIARGVISGGA